MGKFKNFMASMKSKIACALANLFPTWAIKKKCLLSNPNASAWAIYNVDLALYIVTKLNLTEKEIAERYWVPTVRIALLQRPYGRKALASKVATDAELEVILLYGTLEEKVSAVRAFTPSTKRM